MLLISAAKQNDSVIYLSHFSLSEDTEYSRTLFFIHSMYNSLPLLISNSQNIPPPLPLPLGNHKSVSVSQAIAK